MSETSGVPEAVRLLERAIFGLRVDRLFERDLRNDEVLSVLAEVRSVLLDVMPEWAEVSVRELLVERDGLRAELRSTRSVESRMHCERDGVEAEVRKLAKELCECVGERDRARGLAVRLEQELAEAEGWVEAYRTYVRTLESRPAEVSSS